MRSLIVPFLECCAAGKAPKPGPMGRVAGSHLPRLALVITALLSAGCATIEESIDHRPGYWEESYNYPYLWRRVSDDPAVFVPKAWPSGESTGPDSGEWVVDPFDKAAFFVPNRKLDGISPAVWKAVAEKAVNQKGLHPDAQRDLTMGAAQAVYFALPLLNP